MHDLDHTLAELADESVDETFSEYTPEMELPFGETLSEAQQVELAAELLAVSSEEELDEFLGNLIKRAGHAVGKFVRSPTGRILGGFLKAAVKTAVPVVGSTIAAGLDGATRAALTDPAGDPAPGSELDGLSGEDAEWEAAKGFVRLADAAAKEAARAPAAEPPRQAAKAAITKAARRHAPQLLKNGDAGDGDAADDGADGAAGGGRKSGRWSRRGNRIVLVGV